ncbi:uncharacterized protein VDAG_07379 [Verticillium dahliae VdLs.17]|uniref:Uncharacterized protein n=1 Tax=Verticillium dahliae (strain VdLs.17 / ATCC MYA-4575 / FGSC 10137) TaxID=498257 RepID=G2XB00_VERDV|nr:uncharacterized protein VDAG_07379 [Verticillium dahliae VdLs.17]EGY16215.1 hypothetical protein VDAG_07379 [Verticillium dahliae VdLs.17]KAH6702705.1 hypothetical protein EV126DRAFT_459504 [Verticillium dahliae]
MDHWRTHKLLAFLEGSLGFILIRSSKPQPVTTVCSTHVVQKSVNRTCQAPDDGTYTHRLHHCYSFDWPNHHSSPRVYLPIVPSENFQKGPNKAMGILSTSGSCHIFTVDNPLHCSMRLRD